MLALGEKRTKNLKVKFSYQIFKTISAKFKVKNFPKIINEKLGKRDDPTRKERILNMNRKVLVVCHLPTA